MTGVYQSPMGASKNYVASVLKMMSFSYRRNGSRDGGEWREDWRNTFLDEDSHIKFLNDMEKKALVRHSSLHNYSKYLLYALKIVRAHGRKKGWSSSLRDRLEGCVETLKAWQKGHSKKLGGERVMAKATQADTIEDVSKGDLGQLSRDLENIFLSSKGAILVDLEELQTGPFSDPEARVNLQRHGPVAGPWIRVVRYLCRLSLLRNAHRPGVFINMTVEDSMLMGSL